MDNDFEYLFKFCREVYHKSCPVPRKFIFANEFVFWVIQTYGHRPSTNHHLFLTGDYEDPAEWREITNWKLFYQQTLNQ